MPTEQVTKTEPPAQSPLLNTGSGYPKRRSGILVRVVDGETVVLDRQKGLIHQLNHTASYIWDQCDGTSPVEAIAARFSEAFAVDGETAAKDVTATVLQFRQLHLLE
ncbi:MAG: PqqD family protein [Thermodesulfobacteriota bacterium]|jgi:hypothetical protein